jgi:hypothetical protein
VWGAGVFAKRENDVSMASENSHEIEIVTANFYFSVSPSKQNSIGRKRWSSRELDGKHGQRSKQASYKRGEVTACHLIILA